MSMKISQWGILVLAAFVLTACAVTAPNGRHAPVMEYGADKKQVVQVQQPAAQPAAKKPVPVMDSEYETVTRVHAVQ